MPATRKGGKGKPQTSKGKKRNFEEEEEENSKNKQQKPTKAKRQNISNEYKATYGNILSEKLGLSFPDDFFWFFGFLKKQQEQDVLGLLDLAVTGPYDFLNEKIEKTTEISKEKLNLHGRFYTDTPEISTVLYSTEQNDSFHISYYRDDPAELPSLVVSCKDSKFGELQQCGDNIFTAVCSFAKEKLKKTKDAKKKKSLEKLIKDLESECSELDLSTETNPKSLKERSKRTVTKSFNKVGLVVPVDDNDVGYRELRHSDKELKKLLSRIVETDNEDVKNKLLDEIQETITFIQFANDECDYGMGLELGIDLFVFGHDTFHGMIEHLLPLAYRLLRRDLFAEIVEAHLAERKKDGPILVV